MGWWPFRRRQKAAPGVETPPAGHGDTSEVWAVGDLAECISPNDKPWHWGNGVTEEGPCFGEIRMVAGIWLSPKGETCLMFKRYGNDNGYKAICFRKILPRADRISAADAGFINFLTKVQS